MTADAAFVGDVHGSLLALRGMCDALARHGAAHVVFLGDYINKGDESAAVLNELIHLSASGHATLLAGNHETALLSAFEHHDLTSFLRMGGAATIRSYVGHRVGPDVLDEFSAKFPEEHLEAIRRMPVTYETADLVAQHRLIRSPAWKFRISAHVPVGIRPLIGRCSAQLDTGCGTQFGRLTALLWPSLDHIQVNALGEVLSS